MAARRHQVKDLFADAVEHGVDGWRPYLDAACGADASLRAEVSTLVRAYFAAGSFLERPPLAIGGLSAGSRVGAYEIVGELGRGGMGTVYRARRADAAFEREVAVKIVRAGLAAGDLAARFARERQILARLDHPHIARLLDGGTTDDGEPYLVMERVDGEPLLAFAAARALDLRARVRLFRGICAAVRHAHQHLVIHRDLKPSNVLVTAEGIPKLLDFGIAKLLEDQGDETLPALRALTPDYASPEQIRGAPVTTASDVYSLGVVLHELLVGARPYRVAARDPTAMARAVEEAEVDARPLRAAVGRELAAIVLRAVRKPPGERYGSVVELDEDLGRWLGGLPVAAHEDGLVYRAGKFVRRHRAGVAAAVAVAASLIAAAATTTVEMRRAERERGRALASAAAVRQLATSNLFEVHDAVAKLPGSTAVRAILVGRALAYLERLAALGSDGRDPALDAELAAAYEKVGDIQGLAGTAHLGDAPAALQSYGRARALRERLALERPGNAEAALAGARVERKLSVALLERGAFAVAEESARRALLRVDALAGAPAPDVLLARATTRAAVAQVLVERERPGEALPFRVAELALEQRLIERSPADRTYLYDLALTRKRLGGLYQRLHAVDAAIGHFAAALVLDTARAALDPTDARVQMDLSYSYGSLGFALADRGQRGDAIALYERALALRQAAAEADPSDRRARYAVWSALDKLGAIAEAGGDAAAARAYFRRAVPIAEGLAVDATGDRWPAIDAWAGVGRTAAKLGDDDEARAAFARGLEHAGALPSGSPPTGERAASLEHLRDGLARLGAGRAARRP